jgi:putative membrane protein
MIQRLTHVGGLALAVLVLAGPTFARAQAQPQKQGGTTQDAIRGSKPQGKTTTAPVPAPAPTPASSTAPGASGQASAPPLSDEQKRTFGALWLRDAYAAELANLAASKGESQEVKALGQRLVGEHMKRQQEIKTFVAGRGIADPSTLPTPNKQDDPAHRAMVQRLQGLSGAEFDRAFVKEMADVQNAQVDELKRMRDQTSGKDVQLKEWLDAQENGAEERLTATRQAKQALDAQRAAAK